MRKGERGALCKLFMGKAHDHVARSFLLYMTERMGFRHKWQTSIKTYITTSSFSVLVNDGASNFFKDSRGLRQGDPLYPLLFLILKTALTILHINARELNLYKGVKVKETTKRFK